MGRSGLNPRANVFAIHSWEDADACRRMEELLRASDPDLAHYSLPPERALGGTPDEIRKNIASRIRFATAVVVMNTPELHTRPTAGFEMETAVRMGKRIVVVQPFGEFDQPIPQALDGCVYRFAPWRSDVVGTAIRGEYPQDGRVFDIAEIADRRELVALLAVGVAAMSFLVIVRVADALQKLKRDLAAAGVQLRWDGADTRVVLTGALSGAAIGGFLGALSGDRRTALFAAAAGAAIGAANGTRRVYAARLRGTAALRVLDVEPA